MRRLGIFLVAICLADLAEAANWKKIGASLQLDLDSIRREANLASYSLRMAVKSKRDQVDHLLVEETADCAARRSKWRKFTSYNASGVANGEWWSNAQTPYAEGTPGGRILKLVCK